MTPPKCRLCGIAHYIREGCVFGKNTSAERGEAPKGGERTRGRSRDCSSSRLSARAGGKPVKNSSLSAKKLSKRIRQEGALNDAGGSADAVIAGAAMFAAMGESPERKPGPNRAQNGLTAARGGKERSIKAESARKK